MSTAGIARFEQGAALGLRSAGAAPGAAVLIGVSGGPDSTALLLALAGSAAIHGCRLLACTVDHGIRPPQAVQAELEWIRSLCGSLGVDWHLRSVPAGECERRARAQKLSLEETAREARLMLLGRACDELGAEYAALGHTRDDAVETLLMRVLQGSDAEGLAGIRPRSGRLVRPLLAFSRREVLDYLAGRGSGYRTDETNADPRFLRNAIRGRVIPVLRETVPGFETGLLSMSRKLARLEAFLKEETGRRLAWEPVPGSFRVDFGAFFREPAAVRAQSLFTLFDRLRPPGGPRRLPYRFLEPVLGDIPPRGTVLLQGHGMRLSRSGGELVWERYIVTGAKKSYLILAENDGFYRVRFAGAGVRIRRVNSAEAGAGDTEIRAGAIVPPLVLRSKRRGDGLLLEHGSKSLKELYCEWKVPLADRGTIPILADRRGVVAVLGQMMGFPTRVRADARPQGSGDPRISVSCTAGEPEAGINGRGT
jgi:tRNA(Ile)-lysidine synthetase-like protein